MSCKKNQVHLKVLPLPFYLSYAGIKKNFSTTLEEIQPIYNRAGFYLKKLPRDPNAIYDLHEEWFVQCWCELPNGKSYQVPRNYFDSWFRHLSYRRLSIKEIEAIKILIDNNLISYKSDLYDLYWENINRHFLRKTKLHIKKTN